MRSLTLFLALNTAASEKFTGYVVDNFCWDMEGHVGFDGSQLGTAPWTHGLGCFLLTTPPCVQSGYVLLEELSEPDVNNFTYAARYQLDDAGDKLVHTLAEAESARAGNRQLNEQWTITGTWMDGTINVTEVCLTPSVNNAAQETFCKQKEATEVTVTGYVVDNFCWDMEGHAGFDGSQLGTAPWTHGLGCFLLTTPPCVQGGYVLLEELSEPDVNNFTYAARYQLDDAGDKLVHMLAEAESSRAGNRQLNEQWTITGTAFNGTIAVTKACLTPSVNNAAQETFCKEKAAPTPTPAPSRDTSAAASHAALGALSAALYAAAAVICRL